MSSLTDREYLFILMLQASIPENLQRKIDHGFSIGTIRGSTIFVHVVDVLCIYQEKCNSSRLHQLLRLHCRDHLHFHFHSLRI